LDDRRLLFAALLSLGVLILWQVAFPAPEPPALPLPEVVERMADDAEDPSTGVSRLESSARDTSVADVDDDGQARTEPSSGVSPEIEAVEADGARTIRISTDEAEIELSNVGAQMVSYRLQEHVAESGEGAMDLVRHRAEGPYPFALTDASDQPSAFNDRLFVVEEWTDDHGQKVVEFRYAGVEGSAQKRFVFRRDGMMEVAISVPGNDRWGVMLGPGVRNPDAQDLANRFARRSGVFKLGEEVETLESPNADTPTAVPGRGLQWIGLQDSYFLTALLPQGDLETGVFLPTLVEAGDGPAHFRRIAAGQELLDAEEDLTRELELIAYPGTETFEALAYFGAKNYRRLSSLGNGLQETVGLGFFSFLARPLLFALLWTYDTVVSNYGWAIVLLTLVVRMVLFPLTYKSTVSMRKMQALNPQMQAIRQKFRPKLKDKQGRPNSDAQRKMNEEIMGLYKKEGVNPAGGCLPILLQMPVLFAFYSLLSAAVELRDAPWILWIQDLSAPDPFYVLPIVMGASQYIQQKMMPATGDPTQRRIMMMMPLFFTFLFLKFASGLVLYWLTTNVLTIVQQVITNKFLSDDKGEGAKASGTKQKGHK
jgi:YidC/Oxa1 family membrane protein insertase